MRKILAAIAVTLMTLGSAQAYEAPRYPGPLTQTLGIGDFQVLLQAGTTATTVFIPEQQGSWVVLQNRYDQQRWEYQVLVWCPTGQYRIVRTRQWATNTDLVSDTTNHSEAWLEPAGLARALRRICIHK